MPDELLITTEEFSYFVCSAPNTIRPEFAVALLFSVLAYIVSVRIRFIKRKSKQNN